MNKFLESVSKRDFDRRISEVVEMLEEKQLYGTISLIKDLKYYLDLAMKEKGSCNCQHNSNSRDNEPCCRCDSRHTNAEIVKVDSLEIIVRMIENKPYYEVKYREVGKEDYSIGYSSYNLNIVLGIIAEYFEIVESDRQTNADRIRSMSDEELVELITELNKNCLAGIGKCDCSTYKTCQKCDVEVKKWLQSEAE